MKAVVCRAWGPPESLVIEDRPPLEAEPGKVVVSVKAASVKFSDTLVIQNKYQTTPELPFIPGSEVTGVLKSIGAGVEGAGDIPRIPLNLPLIKGCSIVGVWIGAFAKRDPARHRANAVELWKWFAAGKIKPHAWATYPLEKAADALNALAGRKVAGKVVLTTEA